MIKTMKRLDRAVRDELLRQHVECGKLVERVEGCVESVPDTEGRWADCLRGSLNDLAAGLREHFTDEEESCLFQDVPLAFPQFATCIAELRSEHASFLSSLESALGEARHLVRCPRAESRELRERVRVLIATLRRHEAQENEILWRAYWDDAGGGD